MRALILSLCLGALPAIAQDAAPTGPQTFENFAGLRNYLLNAIGAATQKVWVATTYLTDGEIVSALYIAQYRKLQVQVLLGQSQARSYMSRLNYLKAQQVPVYLWPTSFKFGQPTGLLVDNKLYLVDSDLNSLDRNRRYQVTEADARTLEAFTAGFVSGMDAKIPAVPAPVPLVGTAKVRGGSYRPPMLTRPAKTYSPEEIEGSYEYNNVRKSPDPDIPLKLPDQTIQEKRGS
jgi:hypothetical protein